jgi:predicted ATPase
VRTLPVEEIAARLTDRFRLLVRGDRTAVPRQQTLRALIDWSYDLLTERERAVLRRLSVFAGGWTLEGAEAVAAGGDIAEPDVLDLLSRLIEKSLVAADPEAARYRLLETVRQHALERLGSSGEEARTRSRHLAFYVALAETARPQLVGREQGAWLARLDPERRISSARGATPEGESGEAASAMRRYWTIRGLLGSDCE